MDVLLVGATGTYAGLVLPALTKRGVRVRALIRHEGEAADVLARGATDVAVGDLADAASLRRAAAGQQGVFHLNPAFAGREAELGVAMAKATRATGVQKFVFSSVIHPALPPANHVAKQPVEAAIYESGLNYTVLQPTMFRQNFDSMWPRVVASGRFALPYSRHARVCYVDYRDVAEAVALAFTTERLSRGTFELCAGGQVTSLDLAALISEALGRPVAVGKVPPEQALHALHLTSGPRYEAMRAMFAAYDRAGFAGGNNLILSTILGRAPRTLHQYFQVLATR